MIIDHEASWNGYTPLGLPGQTTVTIPDPVLIRGANTIVTVNSSVILSANVTLAGGFLRGAGDLTLNGSITWTGGGMAHNYRHFDLRLPPNDIVLVPTSTVA